MAETPFRNRPVYQLSLAVAITATAGGVILFASGVWWLSQTPVEAAVGGTVFLAIGLVLMAVPLAMHAILVLLFKAEGNVNRIHTKVLESSDLLHRLEPLIKTISDNSQISDATRSLTHREREVEALRQAIREEMYGGDLEAALYLIGEMERRFGYKQEARALREELAVAREMTIEEKIGEAISHIEKLMGDSQWERARQESERLMRLFPRHDRVLDMPTELNRRREVRKQELLAQWNAAVARAEVDKGIAILTELDAYLTRSEAEALQESARHVFKARLVNLGVRFSLAVSEARWRDALEIGLTLRREFPNSRMAQEVAEKIDTLRVRAGFTANTDVIQRRPHPPAG